MRDSLDRCGSQAAGDPLVQGLRRDVGAVRPDDRSEFRVKFDTLEIGRIRQPLEDSAPLPAGEVDISLGAILGKRGRVNPADTPDDGDEGAHYNDELKDACSLYFVMSEDMRRRVIDHGLPADRVCGRWCTRDPLNAECW